MNRSGPAFALSLACACATPGPSAKTVPHCGEDVEAPSRATLVVRVFDPDRRRSPPRAMVRLEPCCDAEGAACAARPTDDEGKVVLEACPRGRGNAVVVSVDTNPRWYTYTPPRAVRVCGRIEEISIPIERHPPAPPSGNSHAPLGARGIAG